MFCEVQCAILNLFHIILPSEEISEASNVISQLQLCVCAQHPAGGTDWYPQYPLRARTTVDSKAYPGSLVKCLV
jgi:hypothetical protein